MTLHSTILAWLTSDTLADAWHVVARSDPLADSDDEMGDEHCRDDYGPYICVWFDSRVQILTSLHSSATFEYCLPS